MSSTSQTIQDKLYRQLIVSSQASQGEPLDKPDILGALAEAALNGGAVGIRMAQPRNLIWFRERHPEVPLIGITKPEKVPPGAENLVFITPTFQDISAIANHCDIVALDATSRPRPGGATLAELVTQTRNTFPDVLLMADIATLADGEQALALGFDFIGTTLSGYTAETRPLATNRPDFQLLESLVALRHAKQVTTPIILEGRVWEPDDIRDAFRLGAHAVVVGSAITRPHDITRRFVNAIPAN